MNSLTKFVELGLHWRQMTGWCDAKAFISPAVEAELYQAIFPPQAIVPSGWLASKQIDGFMGEAGGVRWYADHTMTGFSIRLERT